MKEESRQQNNALLLSYLQTDSKEESQRLLEQLLARAAPFIENKLGWRFRVLIRAGRSPQSPDAEDQCNEVYVLLLDKLRKLKTTPGVDTISDFQSYVEKIAENAFSNRLRRHHQQFRSLKDALRYLLSGRTKHKAFALWWCGHRKQVGGFAAWRDERRAFARTVAYQQLLDDPEEFARAKLPHEDFQSMGRVELVDALFRWVDGPVELDDLVKVIARLQGAKESTPRVRISRGERSSLPDDDYINPVDEVPAPTPTPLESLQSKSNLQLIWEDLCHLTLEQRRVLLLQAQHDVIEILLRTGTARLQDIAALLEMPVEEVEELRCAGFLSDDRLGRRFGFLRATIMQQRHRARRRMMEWRKRWEK